MCICICVVGMHAYEHMYVWVLVHMSMHIRVGTRGCHQALSTFFFETESLTDLELAKEDKAAWIESFPPQYRDYKYMLPIKILSVVCVCTIESQCTCGSQRIMCGSWLSPLTMLVPGIKLGTSGLIASIFTYY